MVAMLRLPYALNALWYCDCEYSSLVRGIMLRNSYLQMWINWCMTLQLMQCFKLSASTFSFAKGLNCGWDIYRVNLALLWKDVTLIMWSAYLYLSHWLLMLYSCNTGHQVILVCWCMIGKKFPNFTFFMIFVLMLPLNSCMYCLYSKKT